VQAAGKVEIDLRKVLIDYLLLTGHKFHAPKGIGALYVRRKTPVSPFIHGGHQERNPRGGTESVPLIVGIGKAAELARQHLPEYDKKIRPIRDALEEGILEKVSDTELNGDVTQRLSNTTNISFHGIESEALLMKPECDASRNMIRFSLDRVNTTTDVHTALAAVKRSAQFLRV
jgi:cysteine desulfurase